MNFKAYRGFLAIIALALLLVGSVSAAVFINEVAVNSSINSDSEWIEIYNSGPGEVDLNSYNITENGALSNFTLSLSVQADNFILLVRNSTAFNLQFPNLNSSKIIEFGP